MALNGSLSPQALLGGIPVPVSPLQDVATWSVETLELGPPSKTEEELTLSSGSVMGVVAQSCPTPCDPMNRSMPGLPVHHQLLECTQTHAQAR